jgi:hypothetical protein
MFEPHSLLWHYLWIAPSALLLFRNQKKKSPPYVNARPTSDVCAGFVVFTAFTPWLPLDECFYRDVSPTDLGYSKLRWLLSPSHRWQAFRPVQVMR